MSNTYFLFDALRNESSIVGILLLVILGGFIGFGLYSRRLKHRETPKNQNFRLGFYVLAFIGVSHILVYSAFMPWRRYVEQCVPYFIIILSLFSFWIFQDQPKKWKKIATIVSAIFLCTTLIKTGFEIRIRDNRAQANKEKSILMSTGFKMRELATKKK